MWKPAREWVEIIKRMPTVDSRLKGKWIKDRYCSSCEWDKHDFDYINGWEGNFCPNCGADMKGREQNGAEKVCRDTSLSSNNEM